MGVYLHAKFEVSSIILTSFRQGVEVILPPPSPPQNEPLKSPPRLGLSLSFPIRGSIELVTINMAYT